MKRFGNAKIAEWLKTSASAGDELAYNKAAGESSEQKTWRQQREAIEDLPSMPWYMTNKAALEDVESAPAAVRLADRGGRPQVVETMNWTRADSGTEKVGEVGGAFGGQGASRWPRPLPAVASMHAGSPARLEARPALLAESRGWREKSSGAGAGLDRQASHVQQGWAPSHTHTTPRPSGLALQRCQGARAACCWCCVLLELLTLMLLSAASFSAASCSAALTLL
jgi:hypothetical protein